MSGKKCSTIRFDEIFHRTAAMTSARASVEKTCKHLRKQRAAIPAIIGERLTTVTESIERWLLDADRATRASIPLTATATDVSVWQARAQDGLELLRNLSKQNLLETDRLRSDISNVNEECTSRLESHRGLIETWLSKTLVADLGQRLDAAKSTLKSGGLAEALGESKAISNEVSNAIQSATTKEGQHVHNELLREVQQLRRELKNCSYALTATIAKTKEHLQADLGDCEHWLREAEHLWSSTISDDESTQSLKQQSDRGRAKLETGLQLLDDSRQSYHEQLAKLRSEFGTRLQVLQQRWSGDEEGMDRWLATSEREAAKAALSEWQRRLNDNRFVRMEDFAVSAEKSLTDCLDRLTVLKETHQSRLDVLKALRQVCVNLGFGEVSPPRHLVEGDYTSRIALVIDTFNRGQITFYLSLDKIEADSCFEKSHCHADFGQLSEQLQKQFGIHTKFELADVPVPRVIKKDEAEEPSGSGESAQA